LAQSGHPAHNYQTSSERRLNQREGFLKKLIGVCHRTHGNNVGQIFAPAYWARFCLGGDFFAFWVIFSPFGRFFPLGRFFRLLGDFCLVGDFFAF
jgi:hypothetical protein